MPCVRGFLKASDGPHRETGCRIKSTFVRIQQDSSYSYILSRDSDLPYSLWFILKQAEDKNSEQFSHSFFGYVDLPYGALTITLSTCFLVQLKERGFELRFWSCACLGIELQLFPLLGLHSPSLKYQKANRKTEGKNRFFPSNVHSIKAFNLGT